MSDQMVQENDDHEDLIRSAESIRREAYVAGIDAIRQSTELKAMIGYMPDFFGVYDNLKAISIWNSMHPFMACMENRRHPIAWN